MTLYQKSDFLYPDLSELKENYENVNNDFGISDYNDNDGDDVMEDTDDDEIDPYYSYTRQRRKTTLEYEPINAQNSAQDFLRYFRYNTYKITSDHSWVTYCKRKECQVFIILSLICLIIVILLIPQPDAASKSRHPKDIGSKFILELRHMHSQFPSQNRDSWNTLLTCGNLAFNATDVSPTVVLLAGAKADLLNCFAKHLSTAVLSASGQEYHHLSQILVYGSEFVHFDSEIAAKVLDTKLVSILKSHGLATIIDVNLLPGNSASILHFYGDHENAPFKDAFIILTYVHSGDIHSNCDYLVQLGLTNELLAKPGFDHDSVAALMSRIANSIVCLVDDVTVC